jgi:hypothetical protein
MYVRSGDGLESLPKEAAEMRTYALILLLIAFFPRPASAAGRIYCYHDVMKRAAIGEATVRVGGYTVQVGPVPDPTVPGYSICRGSITSAQGKAIFEQDDQGMEIDPITGKDVNGDGEPDAVLVDYSGGAHCCWTYYIVSLGKHPGLIRKFQNRDTATFSDLRNNGEIEIVIKNGSYDFGFRLDHAFSVFPLMIVQLKGTQFRDVGLAFTARFDDEISKARAAIGDDALKEFLQSDPYQGHADDLSYDATESRVLLIVLDYVYSGRIEKAKKALAQMWPASSRERTWQEMLYGYCSGVRDDLGLASGPPCSAN